MNHWKTTIKPQQNKAHQNTEIILCMHPAKERQCYIVILPLIAGCIHKMIPEILCIFYGIYYTSSRPNMYMYVFVITTKWKRKPHKKSRLLSMRHYLGSAYFFNIFFLPNNFIWILMCYYFSYIHPSMIMWVTIFRILSQNKTQKTMLHTVC